MGSVGFALLGALVGAALGVLGNWVAKPKWTEEHPGRVVALVAGLAITSGFIAIAADALTDSPINGPTPPGLPTSAAPFGPTLPVSTPATAPPPATASSPRSAVPEVLVGSWGGGSTGSTANRSYSFSASGDVLYRRGSEDIEGTVVVSGSTLILYLPGSAPQRYRWTVESFEVAGMQFSNLSLDGFSYVRQDSP
jgi:hypothetical protein